MPTAVKIPMKKKKEEEEAVGPGDRSVVIPGCLNGMTGIGTTGVKVETGSS